jgi:3-hydroxyacyl-CoA dehydrogenase
MASDVTMNFNVLGSGIMGQQIAGLLAAGGFDVHIYARSPLQEAALARKVRLLQRQLGIRDRPSGAISVVHSVDALPDDLTIESISEDLAAKQELYGAFRRNHGAPFFTNTSSYGPQEIAGDVQGLHFFNPITIRLVELQLGAPRDAALDRMLAFFAESGFVIVNVEGNRGYIGNYLLFTTIANMLRLVERFNYRYCEIEKVYEKLSPGQDLAATIDIVGVDTTLHIIRNLRQQDDSIHLPRTLLDAYERNILGKKNGTSIRSLLS